MGRARLRRLSWGLTDQAAGSLTTLVLSVAVLRGTPDGAAEFAVVFLVHALAVGFCRSITTEPVAQELPSWSAERVRLHVRASATTGIAVGALSALVSAVLVRPGTVTGLLSLGFTLAVVPTDAVRAAWIGAARTPRAVPISSSQLVAAVAGLVGVLVTGATWTALAPMVLVAAVAAAAVLLTGPSLPWGALRPRHWVYAAEWSFTSGLAQSAGLVVSALGLPLLPLLMRAQGVLFGPLSALAQAVAALAVPEFATARRRHLVPPALALSGALTGLCGLYAAIMVLLPEAVPAALLGNAWQPFRPVLPAAAAAMVAAGLSMGPLVALRAHGAARSSLASRVVGGSLLLVLPVGAALFWGAAGFFWAQAMGGVVAGTWALIALVRVERPAAAPLPQPEPVR